MEYRRRDSRFDSDATGAAEKKRLDLLRRCGDIHRTCACPVCKAPDRLTIEELDRGDVCARCGGRTANWLEGDPE
jgi:hypothetical protein